MVCTLQEPKNQFVMHAYYERRYQDKVQSMTQADPNGSKLKIYISDKLFFYWEWVTETKIAVKSIWYGIKYYLPIDLSVVYVQWK